MRAPHAGLCSHRYAYRHGISAYAELLAMYAWDEYEPGIRRREAVIGRAVAEPTGTGTQGQPRLSAAAESGQPAACRGTSMSAAARVGSTG